MAVVRHVKQTRKAHPPWVALGSLAVLHQHRDLVVNFGGQLPVLTGAKHGGGAGVGVDGGNRPGREGKAAFRDSQLGGIGQEEGEPCRWFPLPHGEQAELLAAVHRRKELGAVLEIHQPGQAILLHQVGEERGGGGVGGHTRGHDHPGAGPVEVGYQFGKQGIGVHVAPACEGETPTVTPRHVDKFADSLGEALGLDEGVPQPMSGAADGLSGQRLDEPIPGGFIGGVGNLAAAGENSCSCSLMRSHGGFPSTTSKPPCSITSGNSRGQWKARAAAAWRAGPRAGGSCSLRVCHRGAYILNYSGQVGGGWL